MNIHHHLKRNWLQPWIVLLFLAFLLIAWTASFREAEAQSGNLVTNPGFEANGAFSQTPTGWSEWSSAAHLDASFAEAGGHTGSFRGAHWKASAYDVYTSQTKTGLTNGLYTLRAWVKSSGGQTLAVMNVKDYGGATIDAAIPTTGTWIQLTTANINVTNGQATFGFYSVAGGNQWINFDDIEFFLQGSATATRTNTPDPTATRTNTPVAPTATRTNTPVPPTATLSGSCGTTNAALNRPATASSVESGSTLTPDKAVDGNTSTRWGSVPSDPQWLYVDLGSTQSICRVKLNWEAAYGKSYQIQTSNNASSWTTIYSTTTGNGGLDDLTGLSGSGRYVRMSGTVRGTQWGYSLWEMDVYIMGTGNPTPVGGPGGTWNLKFSDEFNGTSLDTAKWNTCYAWACTNAGNNELECYTPEDVLVGSGIVRLRAQQRTVTCSSGGTFNYTSGMITTDNKFEFVYGFMEARTRGTRGQGLWPALWTIPGDLSWPPEIDILEILGHEPTRVYMTYHYGTSSNHLQSGANWVGPDFSAGWHTFGVYWGSDSIRWYVDGVERRAAFTSTGNIANIPMYYLANLAVGGNWPGPPDASTVFPNYFEIDYVRIWQR